MAEAILRLVHSIYKCNCSLLNVMVNIALGQATSLVLEVCLIVTDSALLSAVRMPGGPWSKHLTL